MGNAVKRSSDEGLWEETEGEPLQGRGTSQKITRPCAIHSNPKPLQGRERRQNISTKKPRDSCISETFITAYLKYAKFNRNLHHLSPRKICKSPSQISLLL